MRPYARNEIPRDLDPRLVKILRDMGGYMEQVEKGIAAIARGAAPTAGGGGGTITSIAAGDHHKLANLTTYDDHTQYLLLAGRKGGQTAFGATLAGGVVAGTVVNGGNFVTANVKAASATWSGIAIGTSAAVGDLIVLHLSTGPFVTNTNGPSVNHSTITDTKGNVWIKKREYQYAPDAFLNGACTSLWTCIVTTALTSGVDTLTAAFASSITKKAISSHRFTKSAGTISFAGVSILSESDFTGNGPAAMTLSSLTPSVQYIFGRVATIGNAGSAVVTPFVASTNYTAFEHTSSSTSGGTDNVSSFGEYRIISAASDTSDPAAGGAAGGYYISIYYALAVFPTLLGGLILQGSELPSSARIELIGSPLRLYGEDIGFRSLLGSSDLSYIRTSIDGAFVGPIVPQSLDAHPDDIFRIIGSSDPTKKVAFEVDGLTTATTRTLTAPDVSATLLLTQGTSAGQVVGVNAHTGGTASSLVIEDRLLLGDGLTGVNFTAGRTLDIRGIAVNNTILNNIQPSLTSLSGAASGILTGLQVAISGTPGYTSGSFGVRGMFFTATLSIPTGVTLTDGIGALFQTAIGTGSGTVTKATGLRVIALGSTGGLAAGTILGLDIGVSSRVGAVTNMSALNFNSAAAFVSTVTQFRMIDAANTGATAVGDTAAVTDWTGLYIPTVVNPTGIILGLNIGAINNIFGGKLRIGSTTTPSHYLDLAAGTATIAPARLTSATPITTAVAGCLEFQTDDFFATITTGAARKAFILDDGTRLTAGRVPFATTNGRLTDDADLTFAVDTLTITKIAATTLTGLLTFADAIDVAVGTTTGTKLATATTQKLGFWNTAPVVQPTTAGAAATFITNTSLIADDSATFDGYTIGQVVRALRTIGILA